MVRDRIWMCLVLSSFLLLTGTAVAIASDMCMLRIEKAAFDIRALQSQLMIIALKCKDGDYNLFVQQHQAELNIAYVRMASYFARMNHTSGEDERDAFITEMANAHEQAGLRRGSSFCSSMRAFSSDSLTVHGAEEISELATRTGTNPTRFEVCREEPATGQSGREDVRKVSDADAKRLSDLISRLKAGR